MVHLFCIGSRGRWRTCRSDWGCRRFHLACKSIYGSESETVIFFGAMPPPRQEMEYLLKCDLVSKTFLCRVRPGICPHSLNNRSWTIDHIAVCFKYFFFFFLKTGNHNIWVKKLQWGHMTNDCSFLPICLFAANACSYLMQ